jgi:hypothetical protein
MSVAPAEGVRKESRRPSGIRGALSAAWRGWKAFARTIGRIQTAILMFLVYYLVFSIAWAIAALVGHDALDRRWTDGLTYWHKRRPKPVELERYRHQF